MSNPTRLSSLTILVLLCCILLGYCRQPIIIDTDVGSDFDDSAAILLALQNDELDVKLIVTATDNTTARAQIVAKYLLATGRTDIPIGIGIVQCTAAHNLYDWASDIDLSAYVEHDNGTVHADGVKAMADVIESSPTTVDIIAIAPATNFPDLLKRYPDVAKKARIRAMSGSLYRGYGNSSTPAAEYNVRQCPSCSRDMYSAGWPVTITPLDTCGVTILRDHAFDSLLSGVGPYSTIFSESWIFWCSRAWQGSCKFNPLTSDVLYDPVAVTLATSKAEEFMNIEERCVTITDDGHTVVSKDHCSNVQAALTWKDGSSGLEDFLLWLAGEISH